MNRNVLKIIALVSMIVDHVGAYIFPNITILRIIGRIAFPIFVFFIAEGLKFTSNRKKYVWLLLIFALVSQIPYSLLLNWYNLNVLFSFLLAIGIIYIIENFKKNISLNVIISAFIVCFLACTEIFNVLDYGMFGIALVLVFYFVKNIKLKFILSCLVIILLVSKNILAFGFDISLLNQLFSILSLILLLFYNGRKGKLNLKYIFYVTYPLHLAIIYIITLIL